jgi:predicted nucleic acid-binding protein
MKYLLDTNVISELYKVNCSQNVKTFVDTVHWEDTYLSSITIGELCYGIEKIPISKKKHEFYVWLYTKIPEYFNKRIINLDTEIFLTWGKIRAAGRTLPYIDSLIAATVITHNMFLVTRNTKDFEDIKGINMLNPWEF